MYASWDRQANRGAAAETDERQPLDSEQLNAVMRNVYAWMTVGAGISACTASVLSAAGLDAFIIFSALVIVTIVQLGLAFALRDVLHGFSPKRASVVFVIYSVIIGASSSLFFSITSYPNPSTIANTLCLSVASMFAAMTLIGWVSKYDFSEYGGCFLMGFFGLFVAVGVNIVFSSDGHGFAVSLVGLPLISALTAYMTQPIAQMATDRHLTVRPEDTARYSAVAALKLFLSVSYFAVMLPLAALQWIFIRSSHNHGYHGDGGFSLFGDDGGDDGGFFGDFGGGDGGD